MVLRLEMLLRQVLHQAMPSHQASPSHLATQEGRDKELRGWPMPLGLKWMNLAGRTPQWPQTR
jgi:hypothetical protein